jgi:hypothetical protein
VQQVADIAHLAAEEPVHLRWVTGLGEEFYRQGDQEKARNLPPSFLCDRDKPGVTKSQVGRSLSFPVHRLVAHGIECTR